MTVALSPAPRTSLLKGLACLALVAAVAAVGSLSTMPAIPGWYSGLAKPAFTPPNAVFPVAWTLLYAMMAWALFRLWHRAPEGPARRHALWLFGAQLALNAIWSPVFFGLHAPVAGLAVILALLVVLALAVRAAFRADRLAGWLLVPYLAWICYASLLNAAIVRLN